eukprot:TRINITY_DN102817_c0_g1_i1.p1 TRINITY_DN102817_c0_g1~~TRINITY_DN102817_c0_g1_i1.p1  ORF type:complete len:487 (+),score=63.81 TRINITY_DN102817_c0_g1_i1:53-1513(+)
MGCCVCHKLCGQDVDDLFVYDAPRVVRIRDARLGLLQYAMMIVIAIYIVVWQLLRDNSYLKYREPTVTMRMTLQQPTRGGCNPNDDSCQDAYPPFKTLPYCCASDCKDAGEGSCKCPWRSFTNFQCEYVDGAGGAQRNSESMLIGTFRNSYEQTRNTSCSGSTPCTKLWLNTQEQRGVFMADIDEFTVSVDHAVQNQELGISRTSRQMSGWLLVNGSNALQKSLCKGEKTAVTKPVFGQLTNESPCYIRPNQSDNTFDIFTLKTMMMAMGLSLDGPSYSGSGHSIRYEGLTVTLRITYFDTWPWHGVLKGADGQPEISYVYDLIPLPENPYKVTDLQYLQFPSRRVKISEHGIYLSVKAEGTLGVFDVQTLLVTLTTSLTLLAIGATVVKYLAMFVLKQRNYYKELLIGVSPDFSDIRELEQKTDAELMGMLRERTLPQVGTRVQQILAIYHADWTRNSRETSAGTQAEHAAGTVQLLEGGARSVA